MTSDRDIVIKQARIVDPVSGLDAVRDIRIRGGRFDQVRPDIAPGSEDVIHADGLTAAPGLMDAHVHFRDPGQTWKEDIASGCRSAARGGFTRVVCMANTVPPVDSIETLRYALEKGAQSGIHMMQAATVTRGMKGQELTDMKALREAGAAAFTDDGVPLMNEALLTQAMLWARELGAVISLHEEDPLFVYAAGVNAGRISEQLGYPGASHTAEDVLAARDCTLALHTGARLCVQHISSRISVEHVRLARRLGADVHAEATPHHFTLTEEAVLRYGTNARMNPPLRTEEDRREIIRGLQDGTIDMIVTDHAPHAPQEKAQALPQAPSGIIGLETSLALGIRSLVQPGHLSLMRLIELMSSSPARIYSIPEPTIQEGAEADLVLFGEEEPWTVDHFCSKSSNSPFLGWTLPGRIHMTVCGGRVVYS